MRIAGESKQYQDIYEFEIAATRWMRRIRQEGISRTLTPIISI